MMKVLPGSEGKPEPPKQANGDPVAPKAAPAMPENRPAKVVLSSAEEHILRCLGGAVVDYWSAMPTSIQRAIFARAGVLGTPRQVPYLKERLAAFLRDHPSDSGPDR